MFGPNFAHHVRIVSYETEMPRASINSSTSRKLKANLANDENIAASIPGHSPNTVSAAPTQTAHPP
jgi:hypothetical protein